MELLYDSVCELRDKTSEFLNKINIAIVTDRMVDNYKNGIEYDFSEYGFDSSVAQQIWTTAMYPFNSYVENAISEILHNCINIQTDSQLERYLSHSIKRFKQIKERVDYRLYVDKTLTVYDYTTTIPHKGSPIVFTRERAATKVEQIFDFVQCYSLMIQSVITLMEEKRPQSLKEIEQNINNLSLPSRNKYNLKAQFLDQAKYDYVIDTLVKNGNLSKDSSENLIFIKGHRSGILYGVEAIRIACDRLGFLKKQSNLTNPQILEIHRNTFKDWNADVRTLNNKNLFRDGVPYFLAVLSQK